MDQKEIIRRKLKRILPTVQKPGRYFGGELNSIVKDWTTVDLHMALVFPDIYDLGLPNLGIMILYELMNQRQDALCERAYAPWLDMEKAMRENDIPLYSLESLHPLSDFDIIGFTLPYETLYTNALNVLDLARIPLKAAERTDNHPLVIAGGHATYNPEPMAQFIDAFVIGEGEDVLPEIVDCYKAWKASKAGRKELLLKLSQIQGVYVPSLYRPAYDSEGHLTSLAPIVNSAPARILKRIAPVLPPPPTHFIVPSIGVVHNRIAIEIMRGCTRGCRFCHAGFISRPVRERTVEQIVETVQKALDATGYEEIALLSLSSSDYTHINELVTAISTRFAGKNLTISLPSLRIESFSVDLMESLRGVRQGGFTLAPEAATDRMRNIINKPIQSSQLLETAEAIYSRGWQTIKLYFMIGHPSETLEDVAAIGDLCRAVLNVGHKTIGKRASLHVGVSTFVPKPHTPFQWVPCDDPEKVIAKQAVLWEKLKGPGIKLVWSNPKETMLEAVLTRGDRRVGDAILNAWRMGAKFDAWQDQYHYDTWIKAFEQSGLDPAFYAYREREADELLPWDHISPGVSRQYLVREYEKSKIPDTTRDCRANCTGCGILPAFNTERRENPGDLWLCPEV